MEMIAKEEVVKVIKRNVMQFHATQIEYTIQLKNNKQTKVYVSPLQAIPFLEKMLVK